jgi:hypothetical protein
VFCWCFGLELFLGGCLGLCLPGLGGLGLVLWAEVGGLGLGQVSVLGISLVFLMFQVCLGCGSSRRSSARLSRNRSRARLQRLGVPTVLVVVGLVGGFVMWVGSWLGVVGVRVCCFVFGCGGVVGLGLVVVCVGVLFGFLVLRHLSAASFGFVLLASFVVVAG